MKLRLVIWSRMFNQTPRASPWSAVCVAIHCLCGSLSNEHSCLNMSLDRVFWQGTSVSSCCLKWDRSAALAALPEPCRDTFEMILLADWYACSHCARSSGPVHGITCVDCSTVCSSKPTTRICYTPSSSCARGMDGCCCSIRPEEDRWNASYG